MGSVILPTAVANHRRPAKPRGGNRLSYPRPIPKLTVVPVELNFEDGRHNEKPYSLAFVLAGVVAFSAFVWAIIAFAIASVAY